LQLVKAAGREDAWLVGVKIHKTTLPDRLILRRITMLVFFSAANLQVCPNARISCCTAAMERKYVQASRRDMEMMLDRNFRTLTIDFSTFVREFQGKLYQKK